MNYDVCLSLICTDYFSLTIIFQQNLTIKKFPTRHTPHRESCLKNNLICSHLLHKE